MPESFGKIERFLLELSHEAHQMLPADHAERLVEEARAHLHESARISALRGESPEKGEVAAIEGFGPVRRFVHRIADAAETRISRCARAAALCLGLGLLIGLPILIYMAINLAGPQFVERYIQVLFFVGAALFILFSFLGRRPQTGLLCLSGIVVVVSLCAFFGFDFVRVEDETGTETLAESRLLMPQNIETRQIQRQILQDEAQLLALGTEAMSGNSQTAPDALKINGAIIYPTLLSGNDTNRVSSPWASAFRVFDLGQTPWETRLAAMRRYRQETRARIWPHYRATRDVDAAQSAWRMFGQKWLVGRATAIARVDDGIRAREQILATPPTLDGKIVADFGKVIGGLLLGMVAANFIAAKAGRYCLYRWRQWLWRLRTA